ncbi:hypothetical protein BER2_2792 [plant metagenome]|uniref:Uncharacterized protein n=1 Tax=plant metagenome TaxID=1297885 RepID=A0A484TN40_9ZZZZ
MLQRGVDDTTPGTGQCRQYVGGGGWGKIHGQGARIPLALAAPGGPASPAEGMSPWGQARGLRKATHCACEYSHRVPAWRPETPAPWAFQEGVMTISQHYCTAT